MAVFLATDTVTHQQAMDDLERVVVVRTMGCRGTGWTGLNSLAEAGRV